MGQEIKPKQTVGSKMTEREAFEGRWRQEKAAGTVSVNCLFYSQEGNELEHAEELVRSIITRQRQCGAHTAKTMRGSLSQALTGYLLTTLRTPANHLYFRDSLTVS